jgi:nicotinamide riboside kinase
MADRALERVAASGGAALVLDTDLLSTVVYGRYYYGAVSPWLLEHARARVADVYVLCDVDLPWVADGIRDRPHDRETLRDAFRDVLREFSVRTISVSGSDRDDPHRLLPLLR